MSNCCRRSSIGDPNDPTYDAARFSINYRLSREKREFEFVGTRDSRLWSTVGLAPLGTTLRKASELGTDYRYLLDEPAVEEPGATVTHVLTFFEWAMACCRSMAR